MSDSRTHKVSWKKDKRLQKILKQNAELRAAERYKKNTGLDIAVMAVVGAGCILYFLAVTALGVAGLLLTLVGIIVAAFAVGSIFKD